MNKNITKKIKKPWLAAVLNFVLNGVGYIYNGKRVAFGVLILISSLIALTVESSDISGLTLSAQIIAVLSYLLMAFAFAYDAYKEAKDLNT